MEQRDIDVLLKIGLWVSVTPVMSNEVWKWTCGIYKRGKKTGNWVTDKCKTFSTPGEGYEWALELLQERI